MVDRSRLIVRNAAKRRGEVHDGLGTVDRLPAGLGIAQVADDRLGSPRTQCLGGLGVSDDDTYPLALCQQPRHEAAAEASACSAHKGGHYRLLTSKSLAGNQ